MASRAGELAAEGVAVESILSAEAEAEDDDDDVSCWW
jgi:hypothetical protein